MSASFQPSRLPASHPPEGEGMYRRGKRQEAQAGRQEGQAGGAGRRRRLSPPIIGSMC